MEATTVSNPLLPAIVETQVGDEIKEMLIERFTPFLEQVSEWKEKAESLVVTDVSQTREMKMAKEARLALKDIRVTADKIRKELKEDSNRYNKAVQAVYNVIEASITPIEEHLHKQEKFKEVYEMQQREKLRLEREELSKDVRQYMIANINLGEITEDDFTRLLDGAKLLKQQEEEAKAKAEAERIEREKAEAEERERLRIENERLRTEAEKREAEMKAERDRLEQEQRAKNIAEAKARKEIEQKAAAAKAELERIEAELKAEREAKERAEAEREAAEQAELAKNDRQKVVSLVEDLKSLKTKYEFKAKKYKVLYFAVCELLEKIIVYINSKN